MSSEHHSFSKEQFNRLFPFHFRLDADLKVISMGPSMEKICADGLGKAFANLVTIQRPRHQALNFEALMASQGELIVLKLKLRGGLSLRGAIEAGPDGQQLYFLGTPWFQNMDQVKAFDLVMRDFAVHDSMIDLLHLIKTQDLAMQDVNDLLEKLRKQTEVLKQEQGRLERLSLVAKAAKNGIVFTDLSGKITWHNDGFSYLSGFAEADALGKNLQDLLLEADLVNFGMEQNAQELLCRRKDGSRFWAKMSLQQLGGNKERGKECLVIIDDIHEQKLADQELRTSETRLSAVIRNLMTGILLESEDRRIILVNAEFCELFGIPAPPELLVGQDCSQSAELSKVLFVDEEGFVQDIQRLLDRREPVSGELLQLKDGRVFERAFIPVFEGEHYRGHLWRYDDITEREIHAKSLKIQEEKYRNIIANMNLGLLEVDLNDLIHHANNSFLEMSGFGMEEVRGKSASQLVLPEEFNELIAEKQQLREDGIADMYEIPVRNKAGETRWWMVSGAPNYDDEGNLIGSIGIHLDITEQKKLEQELIVAKARAEASTKAMEAFLANMSHEIRTPLNAIMGLSRELAKGQLSEQQSSLLQQSQSAAHHLLGIINNILDMSKIEAGELRIENEHFEVRSLIKESIKIVQINAERKGISLETYISDDVQATHSGDAMRIKQVLLNLLGNAIKFTDEGKVELTCRVFSEGKGMQTLLIVVSDTGIGMEKHFLQNLFSKFSQEDASTARRFGGTGLGMAICKELVEMMGGSILAHSERDKGSSIEVLLPLSIGQATQEKQELQTDEDFGALAGKRILVAEDNALNRLVAASTLEHFRMEVTAVENGLLAIAKLQESAFDLVLMDVQMPVMDGLAATKEVRTFDKETPIVALSANAFQREIEQCLESGMNAYITKPFDEHLLIRTIFNLTISHRQRDGALPNARQEEVWDLFNLEQIAKGKQALILRLMQIFLEETPPSILEMEKAIATKDHEKLQTLAHRLKGSIQNMGFRVSANHLRKLELLAKSKDEGLATEFALLKASLNKALEMVKAEIQNLS